MRITKVRLATTLAQLREHSACESGYRKLRKSLGLKWPDDKPINLLRVLKPNGVQDMLWCLRCTSQDNFKVRLLMSADFAQRVLKFFTQYDANDKRPALAIQAARDRAYGRITYDEAARAAGAAAWAARAAAEAGKERVAQAAIIRKYLR